MEIFFSLAVASQLLWFLVCGRFLGMPTCHAHTQHSTKLADLCSSGNQVPWTTQHHCSDWAVWILQEFWRYIVFWLYLLAEIYPRQWRKIFNPSPLRSKNQFSMIPTLLLDLSLDRSPIENLNSIPSNLSIWCSLTETQLACGFRPWWANCFG